MSVRQTGLELEYGGKRIEPKETIIDFCIKEVTSRKGIEYQTRTIVDTGLDRNIICVEYEKIKKKDEFIISCLLDCEDTNCSGFCVLTTNSQVKVKETLNAMVKNFNKHFLKIKN